MNNHNRLRSAARQNGAISVNISAQFAVAREAGLKNGACYGLVLRWLGYWRRTPLPGFTFGRGFLQDLHEQAALNAHGDDGGFAAELEKVHKYHQGNFENVDGLRHEQINVLERAGLHLREKRKYDHHAFRWRRAAAYIAKNDGYYVVGVPHHAMGAVSRDGLIIFYDPNFGEVAFANATGFIGFIARFLGSGALGVAYRGEHRTDHIKLRRYQ